MGGMPAPTADARKEASKSKPKTETKKRTSGPMRPGAVGRAAAGKAMDAKRDASGDAEDESGGYAPSDAPAPPPPPREAISRPRDVSALAGIAIEGCRVHISRRRFQAIGQMVQQLRAMHRAGRLIETVNSSIA